MLPVDRTMPWAEESEYRMKRKRYAQKIKGVCAGIRYRCEAQKSVLPQDAAIHAVRHSGGLTLLSFPAVLLSLPAASGNTYHRNASQASTC